MQGGAGLFEICARVEGGEKGEEFMEDGARVSEGTTFLVYERRRLRLKSQSLCLIAA